jgi:hypothetical protein
MVFGIGEGSIDIAVERVTFSHGETIKGKVVLSLSKPKKAKGLRIRLVADREEAGYDSKGRERRQIVVIYSKEDMLGQEQEYAAGKTEYPFEFLVPDLELPKPNELRIGPLSLQAGSSPLRWRLDASLDLPMALDINRKIGINVI